MNAKPLTRIRPSGLYWRDPARTKHEGNCSGLSGDCSGLSGNCSGLSGNCSGLSGDCSDIPSKARPCTLTAWIQEP